MDNFVVQVDLTTDFDSLMESVAQEVKGLACSHCGRSNVPLNNFEEWGEGIICSDCLKDYSEV